MLLPPEDYARCGHDDVRHGFVLTFPDYPPKVDLPQLQENIHEYIRQDLPVTYVDENHVSIGDMIHTCNGPRIHVSSTGQIGDLQLLYRFVHDKRKNRYLLVGCIGEQNLDYIRKMNPGQF